MVVFLLLPNIVFSINCPNCNDPLCCLQPRQVYCNYCGQNLFPNDLFDHYRRGRAISEQELVIGQVGTHLELANQLMLYSVDLSPLSPIRIISNQNLDHLLSYLRLHYPWLVRNPNIIFSSIVLAQLLILNVPALSRLESAEQQVALWWLIGYWLLYASYGSPAYAENFLSQAPESLQLDVAQNQIQSLQGTIDRIPELPDIISLFHARDQPGNQYTLSAALSQLNSMGSDPYLAQVTYRWGIIAILRLAGVYYIITPYNVLFSTASVTTALEILSQIATSQFLPGRILTAAAVTTVVSGLGVGIGAVIGLPILGLSLLGGATPGQALTIYGVWIMMTIAAANIRYNTLGARPAIRDDLAERREEEENKED